MAFANATDLPYFSPIGGQSARGKAPARYSYKTEDALTTVDGAGYFNAISGLLKIGDIIDVIVVTNRGASNEALSDAGAVIVNANASGVVDTTNETAYTTTDSD